MFGGDDLDNATPTVFGKAAKRAVCDTDWDDEVADPIDAREIFDLIRNINDPEHPHSLEELNVLQEDHIVVEDANNLVKVQFTPTIPHCSMATLIGLSVRVRLLRALPRRFKIKVEIFPGTHASRDAVNKQLADKERVAAALENSHLLDVIFCNYCAWDAVNTCLQSA